MTQPVVCQPRRNPSTLLHWSRRRFDSRLQRRTQERVSGAVIGSGQSAEDKEADKTGRSDGELATIARVDGPNYSPVFWPHETADSRGSVERSRSKLSADWCYRAGRGQDWRVAAAIGGGWPRWPVELTIRSGKQHQDFDWLHRTNCCLTGSHLGLHCICNVFIRNRENSNWTTHFLNILFYEKPYRNMFT